MLDLTRIEPSTGATHAGMNSKHPVAFAFGLAIVFACAVLVFWQATGIGYLLDDYCHVGYLYAALHGHPEELLSKLYRVWTFATDSLSAYRPGLSLSFFVDYALGNGQPFAMHLTNVLLTAATCVMVALTSYELSLALSLPRRYLTALASGLLFAVYPLHPEATAWIVGRADVFSSLLYVVSVWGFLNFRRTNRLSAFVGSLVAFFVGLTMKEMPATLPIAITLAAFIIYPGTRVAHIAAYWGVLGVFATLRALVIGQVVGGYGDVGGIAIKQIIRNYMDKDSFLKVLFGATEELPVPSFLGALAFFSLGLSSVLGIGAAITNTRAFRVYAFLLLWCAATLIPAFQIWHIFPNLVGSRVFFIGSAPMCMAIAFAAISCAEHLPKNPVRLPVGVLAVGILAFAWSYALQINLAVWTETGRQMSRLKEQVEQAAATTPAGQRALFADIPQDYKGVPLLGHFLYFERLCKEPFQTVDTSSRILTAHRPFAGGQDFVYPELFQQLRAESPVTYYWNVDAGQYQPLTYQGSDAETSFAFSGENLNKITWQPQPIFNGADQWARLTDQTAMAEADGVTLHVGKGGMTFWLPLGPLNPSALTAVQLHAANVNALKENGRYLPTMLWKTDNGTHTDSLPPAISRDDSFWFMPARNRSWTLKQQIDAIGFALPAGDYFITLNGVSVSARAAIEPTTELSIANDKRNDLAHEHWVTTANKETSFAFDASKVAHCTKVRAFVTRAWQPLPDLASDRLPLKSTIAWTEEVNESHGQMKLPADVLSQPGVHQVAVLPLDKEGTPCGVLSEPRSFMVEPPTTK